MINILGWIVWLLATLIALSLLLGSMRNFLNKRAVSKATFYQGVVFTVLVAVFLIKSEVSKFHLVWAFPLVFILIGSLISNSSLKQV